MDAEWVEKRATKSISSEALEAAIRDYNPTQAERDVKIGGTCHAAYCLSADSESLVVVGCADSLGDLATSLVGRGPRKYQQAEKAVSHSRCRCGTSSSR